MWYIFAKANIMLIFDVDMNFAKLYSFTWFVIICNQNSQSKKKKTSSYIIRCKTWDDVLKQHRAAISKNKKTNSGLVKKEKLGAWLQGLKRCAAKKISASLYKLSFNLVFFFTINITSTSASFIPLCLLLTCHRLYNTLCFKKIQKCFNKMVKWTHFITSSLRLEVIFEAFMMTSQSWI